MAIIADSGASVANKAISQETSSGLEIIADSDSRISSPNRADSRSFSSSSRLNKLVYNSSPPSGIVSLSAAKGSSGVLRLAKIPSISSGTVVPSFPKLRPALRLISASISASALVPKGIGPKISQFISIPSLVRSCLVPSGELDAVSVRLSGDEEKLSPGGDVGIKEVVVREILSRRLGVRLD